jgi:hypothetical protein
MLPQRFDLIGLLAADRQLPVGNQFIPMDFDPSLYELHLVAGERALQDVTVRQCNYGL